LSLQSQTVASTQPSPLRDFAHKLKGDLATLYAESYKNHAMLLMQLANENRRDELAVALDQAEAMFEKLRAALQQKIALLK